MTDPEIQALLISNQALANQLEEDGERIEELEKQNASLLTAKRNLEAQREFLISWLLRAFETLSSKDKESTFSYEEMAKHLALVLSNFGYDPEKSKKATELLKQPLKYYIEIGGMK
jgi:hypothetical protein